MNEIVRRSSSAVYQDPFYDKPCEGMGNENNRPIDAFFKLHRLYIRPSIHEEN